MPGDSGIRDSPQQRLSQENFLRMSLRRRCGFCQIILTSCSVCYITHYCRNVHLASRVSTIEAKIVAALHDVQVCCVHVVTKTVRHASRNAKPAPGALLCWQHLLADDVTQLTLVSHVAYDWEAETNSATFGGPLTKSFSESET